ncbi:hypothetical protein D3H35_07620 [Cohnella faecalis]|uniref:Uncharacterized protein n=1 Tax=Cohnella faecalis TaxID=2315694 RepID=A0A398CZV0_9BACL|nr:hypothetical protein D3H35_07620 [Cohnella faecalis]
MMDRKTIFSNWLPRRARPEKKPRDVCVGKARSELARNGGLLISKILGGIEDGVRFGELNGEGTDRTGGRGTWE